MFEILKSYLNIATLEMIIKEFLIMGFWITVIVLVVGSIALAISTLRELDERWREPKAWKEKDKEWDLASKRRR